MAGQGEKKVRADRLIMAVLALRVRQLEESYPTVGQLAEQTGLSPATLSALRVGRGNPTLKTLSILAASVDLPVWNLLGIREDSVRDNLASLGLDWDEVEKVVKGEKELRRGPETRRRKPPAN